jgi:hypothetical protein
VSAFVEAAEAKAAVVESCIPLDYKIPTTLGPTTSWRYAPMSRPSLPMGHLRRILKTYASYYNEIRTHVALNRGAPAFQRAQAIGKRCRDSGF